MKFILLAATAMLAVPAIAQTTPAPAGQDTMPPAAQTPTTADPAQTADPATAPAPDAAAPANAAPMNSAPMNAAPMGSTTTQSQSMPAQSADGSTPMGGYQPSQPAMSGAASPGVTPTFQPAPSPSQAYPAPAPLDKYPVCKKGQYDKCIQRGGK